MTYETKQEYINPILDLALILRAAKVPFTFHTLYEGAQLRFPWCDGDVICHEHSYGSDHGAVETYQFPWDEGDVSVMSPSQAGAGIITHYNEKMEEEE